MKRVVQFVIRSGPYTKGLQQALLHCSTFNTHFENECIELESIMKDFGLEHQIGDYSELNIFSKALYWIRMNCYMQMRYDYLKGSIVDIQYVSIFYVMLLPFLVRTFDTIVLSFWGSDLLRQNRFILMLLRLLIRRAGAITFPKTEMVDSFQSKFGSKYNGILHVVRFGNYFLDDIDAVSEQTVMDFTEKNHIDTDKTVVMLGYNRFRQQQHILTIQSIVKAEIDRNEVFFVIPWTYGPIEKGYREEIEELLKDRYEYVFLTDYLADIELASLRKATDILISVLTTDALNATMLETLYANGEVLTGKWLSYQNLYAHGVSMRQVQCIDDVGYELKKALREPLAEEKRKKNRDVIERLYRWDNIIEEWVELYKN